MALLRWSGEESSLKNLGSITHPSSSHAAASAVPLAHVLDSRILVRPLRLIACGAEALRAGAQTYSIALTLVRMSLVAGSVIIDFGFAKYVPAPSQTFTLCGTVSYMAFLPLDRLAKV